MEITIPNLTRLLSSAAEMGAKKALIEIGKIKPYMTKSDAFKLYGRRIVERWIKEGLVTPRKDGNHSASWRISKTEIEAVANASNRHTFLLTQDRH